MPQTEKVKYLSKTINIYKVKDVYGDLFYALRYFVNDRNPMDFYHLEGVPDEYDPEVATIIAQLNQQMTAKEVHSLVFKDFKIWFSPVHGIKANYLELANAIFSWLQEISLPEVEIATLFREQK
jgi:hypothetical protein